MKDFKLVVIVATLLFSLVVTYAPIVTPTASAASNQLDAAQRKPTAEFEDKDGKRRYTVHNLIVNDSPYVVPTNYQGGSMEAMEDLFKRNVNAFNSYTDVFQSMGNNPDGFRPHTGFSIKVSQMQGGKWEVVSDGHTRDGYYGVTYSYNDVSDSVERFGSGFPQELLDRIKANPSAKKFKVIDDSRTATELLWSTGGHYIKVNHTGANYKDGDYFVLYYDNIVYVTAEWDEDIPITACPDGSPIPDSGACMELPPPSPPTGGGSSSGGGGGCTVDCTPPPPPPPPDTPKECHPSAQGSYPNCTAGSVDISEEIEKEVTPSWGTGEISWGLSKATKSATGGSASQIASTNLLPIGTGHYEALTPQYLQSGVMSGGQGKTTPKNVTASDKGTELYAVNYDYTNFYIETYKCNAPAESTETQSHISGGVEVDYDVTAYDYNNCYEAFSESSSYWDKVDERANWAKGETYACTQPLAVDHSYGDSLSGTNSVTGTWNIGRHANVQSFANDCNVTANQVFTETLSHTSAHKELNTQTYIEFVENPIVWQGNPNYDTTTVIPYVADATSQGNMGVPELDEVFKKNNKYTNKFNGFEYDYNIPLRQDVTGLSMDVYSKDDFWVSRSTGFVYSVPFPSTAGSALSEVSSKFQGYTGQAYRDTILNRPNLNSVYYLPIDANNNVMKPDTTYKLEMQVRNLGYNNITLHHKQTYLFKYYLLGSVFEEKNPNIKIKVVEQNEIPIDDIKYPYSATISVAQAKSYSAATKGRTNFIFGHKATDAMAVFDQGRAIIGVDFGVRVNNPLKHVIDRESANDTLYTEW